jgi:hypothetical protein
MLFSDSDCNVPTGCDVLSLKRCVNHALQYPGKHLFTRDFPSMQNGWVAPELFARVIPITTQPDAGQPPGAESFRRSSLMHIVSRNKEVSVIAAGHLSGFQGLFCSSNECWAQYWLSCRP